MDKERSRKSSEVSRKIFATVVFSLSEASAIFILVFSKKKEWLR